MKNETTRNKGDRELLKKLRRSGLINRDDRTRTGPGFECPAVWNECRVTSPDGKHSAHFSRFDGPVENAVIERCVEKLGPRCLIKFWRDRKGSRPSQIVRGNGFRIRSKAARA